MNPKAIVAAAALAAVGVGSALIATSGPDQPSKPCVRAPLDGGTDCLRDDGLGLGPRRFFGTGNVFPAAQAAGSNCEPVECTVTYGDNPDTSL